MQRDRDFSRTALTERASAELRVLAPLLVVLAVTASAPAAYAQDSVDAEGATAATPLPEQQEAPAPGTRATLFLTGTALFAGWYGFSVGQSFWWKEQRESEKLRIPVVGPWMTVAHAGCTSAEANCTTAFAVVRAVVAGMSAIGQLGGLAVIGEAALLPREQPRTRPSARVRPPAPSVSVIATGDTMGVSVSGAF